MVVSLLATSFVDVNSDNAGIKGIAEIGGPQVDTTISTILEEDEEDHEGDYDTDHDIDEVFEDRLWTALRTPQNNEHSEQDQTRKLRTFSSFN